MYLKEETKTGGTKRRAYTSTSVAPYAAPYRSMVLRRVNRIARQMKIHNPNHLYITSIVSALPTVSTTGSVYDVQSSVAQGTNFNDRFGGKTQVKRIIMRGTIMPGTTSTTASIVRITIIRAEAGTAFATNMTSSYNPLVTGTSMQLYFDKFYSVPAVNTSNGFPVNIHISKAIKHFQKFSGTAAGTTTGDCVFVIAQSNVLAGTQAPLFQGNMEIFFDPM